MLWLDISHIVHVPAAGRLGIGVGLVLCVAFGGSAVVSFALVVCSRWLWPFCGGFVSPHSCFARGFGFGRSGGFVSLLGSAPKPVEIWPKSDKFAW